MTVRIQRHAANDTLQLTLDKPKGNVLDGALVEALTAAITKASKDDSLRAVVLDSAGNDFSFGASVEEHLPDQVHGMLTGLHRLLRAMLELPIPLLVAVQGRCLGGGLELALAGSRIIASPESTLGQPEVKLGLFAPAASAFLPARMGAAAAEEFLLSGRNVKGPEALAMGLVDELCPPGEKPVTRALAWVDQHLLTHSRVGLRFACRAARLEHVTTVTKTLAQLEQLYLEDLMKTADAVEGLNAFLQKRAPQWSTPQSGDRA